MLSLKLEYADSKKNTVILSIPIANSPKITKFAYEPRDAWCLRGGQTPGVRRVQFHTKGVYLTLYFLALRNDQFLNHSQG